MTDLSTDYPELLCYHAVITGNESDAECEQIAFEAFSTLHPHESYRQYPDRFWEFFQKQRPDISRAEMERFLEEVRRE